MYVACGLLSAIVTCLFCCCLSRSFQALDGLKTRTKRVYLDRLKYMGGTGGGPALDFEEPQLRLTVLQKRVLGLMDRVSIFGREDVPDPL